MQFDKALLETQLPIILAELTALPADQIRMEHRLREDLGLDSVSSLELIGMLDEHFEVEVPFEEAMEIQDVRGIVELAQRYLP